MDYTTFDLWNTIDDVQISNNGEWVSYALKPGKGDPQLVLYHTLTKKSYHFERSSKVKMDYNSNFIAFKQSPPKEKIKRLKKKKVKPKDLPKDTLVLFQCGTKTTIRIPNVRKYEIPKKWGDCIVYTTSDTDEENTAEKDSSEVKKPSPAVKPRDHNDLNGFDLNIRFVKANAIKTIPYVTKFAIAEKEPKITWIQTGDDTLTQNLIQYLDINEDQVIDVDNRKGNYKMLVISDDGSQISYMLDQDTTKALIPPHELYIWSKSNQKPAKVYETTMEKIKSSKILGHESWPYFSEDNKRLFFGITNTPLVQDTSLLDDEIVQVEVWNYQDQVIQPRQKINIDKDKKKSYLAVYHTDTKQVSQLANDDIPDIITKVKKDKPVYIGKNNRHYQKYLTHLGHDYNDIYRIDPKTGSSKKLLDRINGRIEHSPGSKYVYWYSAPDSIWYSYNLKTNKRYSITDTSEIRTYSEINDRPMDAFSYGSAFWTDEDEHFYIYDRFDIWKVDPTGKGSAERITEGREKNMVYRYIRLDRELESLPSDTTILIHFHNRTDRSEGYGMLDLKTKSIKVVQEGPYKYNFTVKKAKETNDLIFSKESFDLFPDLLHTNSFDFHGITKFTSANSQQKEYAWGEISLIKWDSPTGDTLSGLLVVPDGFDPGKKYPLLVNFYERNSHTVHRHRAPYPHRSTINYSYYANKGYVIFNPDIIYRTGEPGESCYDAVISGVEALIEKGFIDEDRMGLQGHSWGGYQIAHLITRTNMFKCAEAGAPVVNMVSAYGGIRWGSGRSRMFQYEKTQSRLGTSLWEDEEPYLANSPIFNMDKVETPVLIMHNDKDGAVPWYQGIEMFMALRRLDKKVWMLNYNDEPHWPVKRENRVDFNRRLEQFFDYYLLGAKEPEWMSTGIPAIEKGINTGY